MDTGWAPPNFRKQAALAIARREKKRAPVVDLTPEAHTDLRRRFFFSNPLRSCFDCVRLRFKCTEKCDENQLDIDVSETNTVNNFQP